MTNTMYLERKSNLVMPSHYVELDKEEMVYVDGGGFTLYTWMASGIIDFALSLCGATLLFTGIKILGKFFGNALAKTLSKKVAQIVANIIGVVAGVAFNSSVSLLGNMIFSYFWSFSSLGGIISLVLDVAWDNTLDGIIYSW